LGITIDFELNFNIANICKKASRQLNILKRIGKYFITKLGRLTIYYSFKMFSCLEGLKFVWICFHLVFSKPVFQVLWLIDPDCGLHMTKCYHLHNYRGNFLDLSKAFDCLPHKLLINKLDAYGVSESALKLIKNYLSNRKQCVKISLIDPDCGLHMTKCYHLHNYRGNFLV
jgi:hypothetical protein